MSVTCFASFSLETAMLSHGGQMLAALALFASEMRKPVRAEIRFSMGESPLNSGVEAKIDSTTKLKIKTFPQKKIQK